MKLESEVREGFRSVDAQFRSVDVRFEQINQTMATNLEVLLTAIRK
jgi:hypothetical protein